MLPESQKEFVTRFNETGNFLKHADRDPDEVHEFSISETESLLFFAVLQFRSLTKDWSPHIRLFWSWYTAHRPEVFQVNSKILDYVRLFGDDREKYWKETWPELNKTSQDT